MPGTAGLPKIGDVDIVTYASLIPQGVHWQPNVLAVTEGRRCNSCAAISLSHSSSNTGSPLTHDRRRDL